MTHTILYYGRFSLNFDRLHKDKENFRILRPDDKGFMDLPEPSDKVDGIVFGYMEKLKDKLDDKHRFFAVKVGNIVLNRPISLRPDFHTDGKGFGPQSPLFRDVSAKRLLNDIILENPAQREQLMEIYNKYFG